MSAGRLVTYWASTGIRQQRSRQHEEQAVYLAADVEAVLDETEEVLDVLINLIPDIGKLSKVQALLATLEGRHD